MFLDGFSENGPAEDGPAEDGLVEDGFAEGGLALDDEGGAEACSVAGAADLGRAGVGGDVGVRGVGVSTVKYLASWSGIEVIKMPSTAENNSPFNMNKQSFIL